MRKFPEKKKPQNVVDFNLTAAFGGSIELHLDSGFREKNHISRPDGNLFSSLNL